MNVHSNGLHLGPLHLGPLHLGPLRLKRVLFSQLKVGETYYEYYTDTRDKFIGFDGYCAIFKHNVFFAYKKYEFYELVPFKDIVQRNMKAIEGVLDSLNDPLDCHSLDI
jgi:hypothetical protein